MCGPCTWLIFCTWKQPNQTKSIWITLQLHINKTYYIWGGGGLRMIFWRDGNHYGDPVNYDTNRQYIVQLYTHTSWAKLSTLLKIFKKNWLRLDFELDVIFGKPISADSWRFQQFYPEIGKKNPIWSCAGLPGTVDAATHSSTISTFVNGSFVLVRAGLTARNLASGILTTTRNGSFF